MPNAPGTKRAKATTPETKKFEVPELHSRIAQRAYQRFEDRGREDGLDLQDWLEAEQEILSERVDTDLG